MTAPDWNAPDPWASDTVSRLLARRRPAPPRPPVGPEPVEVPVRLGRSTVEVCRELNVTYRQLHHWVTRGWIPGLHPQGSGGGRLWRWADEQVDAARLVRDHLDMARALIADPTACRGCEHQ